MRLKHESAKMKLITKVERALTAMALSPLVNAERNERDRRLQERIKRAEEKYAAKRKPHS
jgi:hypothetical protein